jgi:hypothetical protein
MKVERDTVIDRIYNSRISFGEIPPLSTVTTAQFYGLALKPLAPDTVRFELAVEFAAAGFVYWRDTLAFVLGPVTEVAERGDIPMRFELGQNYPNPFNPTTRIRYQVSGASDVRLVVYDFLGREVAVLVNVRKAPGSYDVTFDASGLASGVYVYRLTAGREVLSRKMILVL